MTRQGSFKRAVRQLACESGQRYTEARAALEKGKTAERPTRPFEHAALKAHLEAHYGIRIRLHGAHRRSGFTSPRLLGWPLSLYAARQARGRFALGG